MCGLPFAAMTDGCRLQVVGGCGIRQGGYFDQEVCICKGHGTRLGE